MANTHPQIPSLPSKALYLPLDISKHEIRLLTITRGRKCDALRCSISYASLDKQPSYEALSYAWGDQIRSERILLNNIEHYVTKNLWASLLSLRSSSMDRTLWVDAVCINQGDINERNTQVGMMGAIYKQAEAVIAWLGDDQSGRANLAFEAMAELTQDLGKHLISTLQPHVDPKYVTFDALINIFSILRLPWWDRVWTAQEAILAKRLCFICGSQMIDYLSLKNFCTWFLAHIGNCCKGFETGSADVTYDVASRLETVLDIERCRNQVNTELLSTVAAFRHRQATDASDKIYAFLGLASFSASFIDYTKSATEVYEDFTVTLIESSGTLDVFSHIIPIEVRKRAISQPTVVGLPSWVPNWSKRYRIDALRTINRRASQAYLYKAGGLMGATVKRIRPGKILLEGICCDHIAGIGSAQERARPEFSHDLRKEWQKLSGLGHRIGKLPEKIDGEGSQEDVELRLRTLRKSITGDILNTGIEGSQYQRFQNCLREVLLFNIWFQKLSGWPADFYEEYKDDIASITDRDVFLYDEQVLTTTFGRRFATTTRGALGFVPAKATIGDVIYVLKGGKTPYILRKVKLNMHNNSEKCDCYELLGDAYISGMMEGEIMEAVQDGSYSTSMQKHHHTSPLVVHSNTIQVQGTRAFWQQLKDRDLSVLWRWSKIDPSPRAPH